MKVRALGAMLTLAMVLGCGSAVKDDPILRLSAAESLALGKDLMEQGKYNRARPYLSHAFEVEPNSRDGREALLLVADSYYLEGGSTNYVQAEAKYRDFLNRFPTSDRAAYVQFQIGNSLAKRMERPDRDQTETRKALEAYEELQRLYPTSEYAAQVREQIRLVNDNLAEHEFSVARFYLSFGLARSAVSRLETLLEAYPNYSQKDKVYFWLGKAYQENQQPESSQEMFQRLRQEYPESPFLEKLRNQEG